MLRVVLDTDVVVPGFISPDGASRQLLVAALDRRFSLLLSTSQRVEHESVIRRRQHLAKAKASIAEVDEILDGLASICTPVVSDYLWRPTGAQADDELVVEAAMRQAAAAGISLNLFVATAVAARVGAQAEAERYFAARASRTTPARAKALLERLGTAGEVREGDRLDDVDGAAG